jgi:hypothetical protein
MLLMLPLLRDPSYSSLPRLIRLSNFFGVASSLSMAEFLRFAGAMFAKPPQLQVHLSAEQLRA